MVEPTAFWVNCGRLVLIYVMWFIVVKVCVVV